MDSKLKRLMQQLERAGGLVHLSDDCPPEVAELFYREIMSCPECAAEIAAAAKQQQREREH